uniref:HECT-type E3 ubiquitin transferase n=1 Tax=Taenia asiatica TaxID=60517 RepID=A0A0R3W4Q5_TAEAS
LIQNRDYLILWISQTRWILSVCVEYFVVLNPANEADSNMMNVLLSFVLTMTNCNQWKILKDSKMKPGLMAITDSFVKDLLAHGLYPALKQLLLKGLALHLPVLTQISLTGIFSLAVRPLLLCDFPPEYISLFVVYILSVPGFVLHLNSLANEAYDVVVREKLCSRVVTYLHESLPAQSILDCGLEGSYALCLIANLIQLSLLEVEVLVDHCEKFCIVLSRLLDLLGGYVGQKNSNLTCWHPILGWFSKPLDNYLQASAPHVASQLRLLWHSRMVRLLFADLYQQEGLGESEETNTLAVPSTSTSVSFARSPRFKFTEHTVGERKAVEGLLPVNPPSFVSRHYGRGFSDRFGLSAFLRQLKNRIPVRKGDLGGGSVTGTPLKYHHHWPRESETPGPENLPNSIKVVCMLYCFTIGSLKEIRNDILAGLTLGDLLPRMWRLISCAGSIKDWAPLLTLPRAGWQLVPHSSHLLHLFAAATSNLLIILDDVEVFEKHKAFEIDELLAIADFFNYLIYETVLLVPNRVLHCFSTDPLSARMSQCPQLSTSNTTTITLFSICLRLLAILYNRDSRCKFTPPHFWLICGVKPSAFVSDLRKEKAHATFLLKHVPHIIARKERVLLFRELVRADKSALGILGQTNCMLDSSAVGAVIMIHRNRIVEDGYQQLANLTPTQLRMKIRVQFINALGLDEVGIDLDGVFKEFLEETLRRVFDPTLNLFRATSDQRLYPSPTSHIQESHLQLFEFVGKLLAKAVYEGIIVDVPFANFFLTQVLGRQRASCYSFLDELATLDRDLYKSLTYIKHYEGDVSDLELTFSYDEDCLGRMVVHDLVPGGRYITVNNDLKISYVHRMAMFRMYKQIRGQTASFIRGFYSIINPDWLAMFSPMELQQLISGDSVNFDLEDLKQHTKYSGGFYSNHRVITWLWDILKKDFSDEERGLFLKFVTSCSKPPLLGFAYLEPPFCIRCVQYINEDQDMGDTLGSVLKGFFGFGSRRGGEEQARLPSASTCFNLLKLPNYASRATLRDKLRYAIHSNAGFELS